MLPSLTRSVFGDRTAAATILNGDPPADLGRRVAIGDVAIHEAMSEVVARLERLPADLGERPPVAALEQPAPTSERKSDVLSRQSTTAPGDGLETEGGAPPFPPEGPGRTSRIVAERPSGGSLFLVERYLPEVTENDLTSKLEAAARAGRSLAADHHVRHVNCTLLPVDEVVLCLFWAGSAEIVAQRGQVSRRCCDTGVTGCRQDQSVCSLVRPAAELQDEAVAARAPGRWRSKVAPVHRCFSSGMEPGSSERMSSCGERS